MAGVGVLMAALESLFNLVIAWLMIALALEALVLADMTAGHSSITRFVTLCLLMAGGVVWCLNEIMAP